MKNQVGILRVALLEEQPGGLIQGLTGCYFGPVGLITGGGIGSGIGTFLTEYIDACWLNKKLIKPESYMVKDSLNSGFVALATSSLTAIISSGIQNAMKMSIGVFSDLISPEFGNMVEAFFSAMDDALTYLITGDY